VVGVVGVAAAVAAFTKSSESSGLRGLVVIWRAKSRTVIMPSEGVRERTRGTVGVVGEVVVGLVVEVECWSEGVRERPIGSVVEKG